jgi:hypothetical protein
MAANLKSKRMSKALFQIYLALPDPLSFLLVTTFKDEKSKAEISQKPEAVIFGSIWDCYSRADNN